MLTRTAFTLYFVGGGSGGSCGGGGSGGLFWGFSTWLGLFAFALCWKVTKAAQFR